MELNQTMAEPRTKPRQSGFRINALTTGLSILFFRKFSCEPKVQGSAHITPLLVLQKLLLQNHKRVNSVTWKYHAQAHHMTL